MTAIAPPFPSARRRAQAPPLAACGVVWALAFFAQSEEAVELRLQLDAGRHLRYSWTIDSSHQDQGRHADAPFQRRKTSAARLIVRLDGTQPAQLGELSVLLRYSSPTLEETTEESRAGKTDRTFLTIDRRGVIFKENDRTIVDSRNDLGLEKLTGFHNRVRSLEQARLRLQLSPGGRILKAEGDRFLLERVPRGAGAGDGLFPLLPEKAVKAGDSWEARTELPSLGEIRLPRPAALCSRVRLARWEGEGADRRAVLEVVWKNENPNLEATDPQGSAIKLSGLKVLGTGLCRFNPAAGCYTEGAMSFEMKYRAERGEGAETEASDRSVTSSLNLRLLPPENGKKE